MDIGLNGKTAIVCASSRGLGKGCAMALAAEGVNLIINGRNKEVLKQIEKTITKGYKVVLWPDDVKEKDINEMILSGMTKEDVKKRNLPTNTTGVVITEIDNDSPLKTLNINNIIVEAQKKKIKTIGELDNIVKIAIKNSEKTILIAIYNNQNQRRYIGVKID